MKSLFNSKTGTMFFAEILFLILIFIHFSTDARQKERPKSRNRNREERTPQKNQGTRIGVSYQEPSNGNIILEFPNSNSINARIIFNKGFEGFIEYGTKSGKLNSKITVFQSVDCNSLEILIAALKENQKQ